MVHKSKFLEGGIKMLKKRHWGILGLAAVLVLAVAGSASATPVDITIYDGRGIGTGWYGAQEDQEVEPGCATGDVWDLEGFLLDKVTNTLSMVGTYDFAAGASAGSITYGSGDIFVDVLGADYSGQGWDYAIDLSFGGTANTYTIYQLNAQSSLTPVMYAANSVSNPWELAYCNETIVASGAFGYQTGIASGTGLAAGYTSNGATHNAVSLSLAGLFGSSGWDIPEETLFHFTMECGNDNLVGKTPVPEPASITLLGLGIAGMALRRFRKK